MCQACTFGWCGDVVSKYIAFEVELLLPESISRPTRCKSACLITVNWIRWIQSVWEGRQRAQQLNGSHWARTIRWMSWSCEAVHIQAPLTLLSEVLCNPICDPQSFLHTQLLASLQTTTTSTINKKSGTIRSWIMERAIGTADQGFGTTQSICDDMNTIERTIWYYKFGVQIPKHPMHALELDCLNGKHKMAGRTSAQNRSTTQVRNIPHIRERPNRLGKLYLCTSPHGLWRQIWRMTQVSVRSQWIVTDELGDDIYSGVRGHWLCSDRTTTGSTKRTSGMRRWHILCFPTVTV